MLKNNLIEGLAYLRTLDQANFEWMVLLCNSTLG